MASFPDSEDTDLNPILTERLAVAVDLSSDLVAHMSGHDVALRLSEPSNTIWDQFWCVVGARESYAKAISAGEWVGFTCSLTGADRGSQASLREALESSRREVEQAVGSSEGGSEAMVFDLLLHETQHHGQLIRYVYGLGLVFPPSWRDRWNL